MQIRTRETAPHTHQHGQHQKDTGPGEDTEKREHLGTAGGNVNRCSYYVKQGLVFSKKEK